jgi:hypothetical protein
LQGFWKAGVGEIRLVDPRHTIGSSSAGVLYPSLSKIFIPSTITSEAKTKITAGFLIKVLT